LQQLLAIAIGGAAGSVLRFLISSNIYRVIGRDFPYGTLTVNVLGSLMMGVIFVLVTERLLLAAEWRSILMIGFLGAFTTFSTFSMETVSLIENGEMLKAALNAILSVVLCIGATWIGLGLGRQL
jgi:CrcB protein